MKDEFGEYIEVFEVIGTYKDSRHQTVVARATNKETFIKILKKNSRMKHQDDRSHRIYRAYSDKLLENYCRLFADCSFSEFSQKVDKAFEKDNDYYSGNSDLREIEKKIDNKVAEDLEAMMDKHPTIFRTWDYENGFEYKNFDTFFPRISKAYVTFEDKE